MINPSLARRGVDYPGASPPPPGVKANLNHSYSPDRAANIAVLVICLTTVTILFASRVYVKLRIMPGILAEDGRFAKVTLSLGSSIANPLSLV